MQPLLENSFFLKEKNLKTLAEVDALSSKLHLPILSYTTR